MHPPDFLQPNVSRASLELTLGAEHRHSVLGVGFYYARRRLFHRLTITVALVSLLALLALFFREALIALVASIVVLVWLDRLAANAAQKIRIRMRTPERATEGDAASFYVSIENAPAHESDSTAAHVLVALRFSGSKQSIQVKPLTPRRIAEQRGPLIFSFTCDAGMGDFAIGPLTLLVSDPLGLFEYAVTLSPEKCGPKITIYPKTESIAPIPLRGSPDSLSYGIYSLQTRGSSVNFIGVRPFSRGDSLRQISWRLSARRGELLVKDFERTVGSTVTLILDMNLRAHVGRQAQSTWEYAKDAAIAMLKDQVAQGNQTQLISQDCQLPFGTGENHFHRLSHAIFGLTPKSDDAECDLILRSRDAIPDYTSVIYIGPCFGDHYTRIENSLIALTGRNIEVVAVLIDSASFIGNTVHGDFRVYIDSQATLGRKRVAETVPLLKSKQIRTYLLSKDRTVGEALLRSR